MARPAALEALIAALGRLPGIGPVTSERLAYHLMGVPRDEALALAEALRRAREEVRVCSICANLDQCDPCTICSDPGRDRRTILVVEGPREVASFEETGYRGLYHVLHGRIAPLEGVGEDDLTIESLLDRVARGEVDEIILATNPDLEGEATAARLADLLADRGVRLTRIARGIPAGASITQVQHTILADALEGRRDWRGGTGTAGIRT